MELTKEQIETMIMTLRDLNYYSDMTLNLEQWELLEYLESLI